MDLTPSNILRKQYKDGIELKFIGQQTPIKHYYRLYEYKTTLLKIHKLKLPFYTIGKHPEINTIVLSHESISTQHCALQYKNDLLYLVDFSTNGTFVNNQKVPVDKMYELRENDVIKFGFSTREYVVIKET